MNKIEEFIAQLICKDNYIRLPYDCNKYDCEISNIVKNFYNESLITIISDFWNKQQQQNFFELKHPIYNEIVTRAVFSINNGECNYIFFIDKTNTYPWIMFQAGDFINKIIIDNFIFEISYEWRDIDFNIFKKLKQENLIYKDIDFGFVLPNSYSLWHFFYEHLICLYVIDVIKPIKDSECFFIPRQKIKTKNNNMVFFMPNFRKMLFLQQESVYFKNFFLNYMANIYSEVILFNDSYDNKNDDNLVLWFGLVNRENEGKLWLNQIESCISIINELKKSFSGIKLYIDGIKINEHNTKTNILDKYVTISQKYFDYIYNNINDVEIIHVNNTTIREAIFMCDNIDIAIVECGSSSIIPTFICNKPSVLYGSTMYLNNIYNTYKMYCDEKDIEVINLEYILDKKNINNGYDDYYISWEHIFNKTIKILNKIKKKNIQQIDVPNMKLLSKQYDLKNKYNIIIPLEQIAIFNEIEHLFIMQNYNTSEHKNVNTAFRFYNQTNTGIAKARIQNQLSYQLGQAMIINSKSLLGYIKMPFVLSYIKDKHNQEQKIYKEKIKKDPSLKLPPLESYPDYKEALKEKQCFTYKLGQALIQAHKTWYKGGYVKLWFEIRRLKREFNEK